MSRLIKKRIKAVSENPYILFRKFNRTKIQRVLPDWLFLKLMFKARLGYPLNLDHPKSFNEKLQWLKLNDRRPEYIRMADKYEAKGIIASKVGDEFVVPVYGVWDKFEEIDFGKLPDSFVLKTTHDAGGIVICKDKSNFNFDSAQQKLSEHLRNSFYWRGREWPYKYVKPRILAEKYIEMDDSAADRFTYTTGRMPCIPDYKLFCFNGMVYCCLVCSGRNSNEGLHENFFDRNWVQLPFKRANPILEAEIEEPKTYNRMIEIAEKIAIDIPFLRVDFFEKNGKPYVGELTFYPANGFGKFLPREWDYKLGEMIKLPID